MRVYIVVLSRQIPIRLDLEQFNLYSESWPNCVRRSWSAGRDWRVLVITTMTTSAYSVSTCRPEIRGWDHMAAARGSITKANTSGERGHPCIVPFEIVKVSEVIPDVQTFADGWQYKASTAVSIRPTNCHQGRHKHIVDGGVIFFPSSLWSMPGAECKPNGTVLC